MKYVFHPSPKTFPVSKRFLMPLGAPRCSWLPLAGGADVPSPASHAPRAQGTSGGWYPSCLFYILLRTRFPLLVQPKLGREAGFASNPKRLHLVFCGSCAHLHHVCLALSMSFVFLINVLFLFFAKPCHGRLQNLRFVFP